MPTFSDFKNNFYSRVPDLSLFDCGDINLLKVVLDGLKVNYVSKGKVKSYLFYPYYISCLFTFIKKTKSPKNKITDSLFKKNKDKTILISDAGRILTDAEGNSRSLYFDTITRILGKENIISVFDKVLDAKMSIDFTVSDIENEFTNTSLSTEDKIFRREILTTFSKIKKSTIFSKQELDNIQFAFHRFFYQYKTWNSFLKMLPNIKKCYFVCHYHKEGQILALKNNTIEAIELQHGLIAAQDIFYVFPKAVSLVKDKALFADKIMVYGQYWKDVLLKGVEYSFNQIQIMGYYLYNDFSNYNNQKIYLKQLVADKDVILVTTQTFIHAHFIDYTMALAKGIEESNCNAIILLKPHPSEKIEIYTSVFSDFKNVKVVENPLPLLLQISKAHVSIYSTTLYDALRYNVKSYVYKVKECEDYVNEIILSGIAEEIKLGQNPLDIPNNTKATNVLESNYYYQQLNTNLI